MILRREREEPESVYDGRSRGRTEPIPGWGPERGMWAPLETGGTKERDSFLEPAEAHSSVHTLVLVH